MAPHPQQIFPDRRIRVVEARSPPMAALYYMFRRFFAVMYWSNIPASCSGEYAQELMQPDFTQYALMSFHPKMKYAYEDLGDEQFETLIVFLCQKLLGISVQGFAKGPDGGRDAKFVGTAELHPSKAAPWAGTIIIQAKHTNGHNRNFSESDFYNPKPDTERPRRGTSPHHETP
jgi:hypothetical protein